MEARPAVEEGRAGAEVSRWWIQVRDREGNVMYLRHGDQVGEGPIVTFRNYDQALVYLDFLLIGLDSDLVATVVKAPEICRDKLVADHDESL